ncbi:glycosyltransferase family 2 protein [Limnobacter sp.]|uniref:glycosyltransferase family 2 protein n=1 Tax=Limnobacter sp. TaxID=2003368 RepID=UPI0025C6E4F1|nr:glycosyltransferase family 2 protein [Limnobacter sp.]
MSCQGLAVVILTYNEELHLERCINGVKYIANQIIVIDSFSTDKTEEIAKKYGVKFVQNAFVNHAQQFNFVLDLLPREIKWVLRIDADEYLTPELQESINQAVESSASFVGYTLKRRMTFGGKMIRYGGVFPIEILRLFRKGHGVCEVRWMDEHITVDGPVGKLKGELIDDNLKDLTWWIQKHNLYSNREAVEVLKRRYVSTQIKSSLRGSAGLKRYLKEHVYSKLPVLPKVSVYFLYRYVFRWGFLDGSEGFAFHFLQGFWYRYLVEAKVQEVERIMKIRQVDFHDAVQHVLQIKL